MSDDAKKMPYNSTYFYHMVKYHYFNDDAKEKLRIIENTPVPGMDEYLSEMKTEQ